MLGRSPGQRPVWLKQASAAQASGPFSCMVVMKSRMADWVGRSGAAQASGPFGWRRQPSHGHLPINIWGVWVPKVSICIMWFPCVWVREMNSTESGGGIAAHTTMGMCTTTFWMLGRLGFPFGSSSCFSVFGYGNETESGGSHCSSNQWALAHEHFGCWGA